MRADAFLRGMVRRIVAALLAVGTGRLKIMCIHSSPRFSATRSSPRSDRDFVVSVHDAYRRIGGMDP